MRVYLVAVGWATIGNMVISAGVTMLLVESLTFENESFDMRPLLTCVLVCSLYVYFAFQIRHRQGSDAGRGRMLTVYDAGRQYNFQREREL